MKTNSPQRRKQLRRRARAGDHFRDRIAVPNAEEEDLAAVRIFKDVVDAVHAGNLKESGAARVRPRWRCATKQYSQLRHFFLRMISQIFQDGRLF